MLFTKLEPCGTTCLIVNGVYNISIITGQYDGGLWDQYPRGVALVAGIRLANLNLAGAKSGPSLGINLISIC